MAARFNIRMATMVTPRVIMSLPDRLSKFNHSRSPRGDARYGNRDVVSAQQKRASPSNRMAITKRRRGPAASDHGYPDSADCSLAKYHSQPRICIATAKPCTHGFRMKIAATAVATVIGMMTKFCAGHCSALPP